MGLVAYALGLVKLLLMLFSDIEFAVYRCLLYFTVWYCLNCYVPIIPRGVHALSCHWWTPGEGCEALQRLVGSIERRHTQPLLQQMQERHSLVLTSVSAYHSYCDIYLWFLKDNMMDGGDDVINFGDENLSVKRKFSHPVAVFFHLAFRIAALVVYLFSTWITSSFIVSFLLVLLLLSLDFWTVKNVTGRMLVGLRWWNLIDEEGVSHWRFESRPDNSTVNTLESRIFWSSLVLCPLLWVLFLLVAFFTFHWSWILMVLLGLAMNGANLYGYLRCKYSSTRDVTNFFSAKLLSAILKPGNLFTGRKNAAAAGTGATMAA